MQIKNKLIELLPNGKMQSSMRLANGNKYIECLDGNKITKAVESTRKINNNIITTKITKKENGAYAKEITTDFFDNSKNHINTVTENYIYDKKENKFIPDKVKTLKEKFAKFKFKTNSAS